MESNARTTKPLQAGQAGGASSFVNRFSVQTLGSPARPDKEQEREEPEKGPAVVVRERVHGDWV